MAIPSHCGALYGTTCYQAPPSPFNAKGEIRKVGIELELGLLSLEQILELVRDAMGGEIVSTSRAEGSVRNAKFGKFKVEVDSTALKERGYLKALTSLGFDEDSPAVQLLEDSVLEVAREFVPMEVVTPPIPWNQLHELDPLWEALRKAGAGDTRTAPWYAFGLHLNPEPPDLTVDTICDLLRGFLLLEDWIMEASDVTLSRIIAPFIRPFPESYRRKILRPAYRPRWDDFVDDYLLESPTRNRPLDLLPLIAHIGAPELERRVQDWALVSQRPTFHYRLPNSELASAGWTPADEWNRWVAVERVAADEALLRELSERYLETIDWPLRMQRSGWVEQVRTRLGLPEPRASAVG